MMMVPKLEIPPLGLGVVHGSDMGLLGRASDCTYVLQTTPRAKNMYIL